MKCFLAWVVVALSIALTVQLIIYFNYNCGCDNCGCESTTVLSAGDRVQISEYGVYYGFAGNILKSDGDGYWYIIFKYKEDVWTKARVHKDNIKRLRRGQKEDVEGGTLPEVEEAR